MQEALQNRFAVIAAALRVDAREADVTVESDRTNIFGAIEELPGGFDGLNSSLRGVLQEWLISSADELLARQDPSRPRMSAQEHAAEKLEHGILDAAMTQLVDYWPALPEILWAAGSVMVAAVQVPVLWDVMQNGISEGTKHSLLDLWMQQVGLGFNTPGLGVFGYSLFLFGFYLIWHQQKRQVRRRTIFGASTVPHLLSLEYLVAGGGYLSFPVLYLASRLGGVVGAALAVMFYWPTMVLVILAMSAGAKLVNNQLLLARIAWLKLQGDDHDAALQAFATASEVTSLALGPASVYTLWVQVGQVAALRRSGRAEEASQLQAKATVALELRLGRPLGWIFDRCMLFTGSWAFLPRVLQMGTANGAHTSHSQMLMLRAALLAANDATHDEVLQALETAVAAGYYHSTVLQYTLVMTKAERENQKGALVDVWPVFASLAAASEARYRRVEVVVAQNSAKQQRAALAQTGIAITYFWLCIVQCLAAMADYDYCETHASCAPGDYCRSSGLPNANHFGSTPEELSCHSCAGLANATRDCLNCLHTQPLCDAVGGGDCCSVTFLQSCPSNPMNCSSALL
jgi:hypothetical protein